MKKIHIIFLLLIFKSNYASGQRIARNTPVVVNWSNQATVTVPQAVATNFVNTTILTPVVDKSQPISAVFNPCQSGNCMSISYQNPGSYVNDYTVQKMDENRFLWDGNEPEGDAYLPFYGFIYANFSMFTPPLSVPLTFSYSPPKGPPSGGAGGVGKWTPVELNPSIERTIILRN